MLIPINYKNNDTPEVKTKIGKMQPFMSRAIMSYLLETKTGIFRDYDDEFTITEPIDYTSRVGYARVTINSGLLAICGGLVYNEDETTFDIPILEDTTTGSFGVKVDLGQPAGSEVSFYYDTSGTLTQQDLQTNEISGVYMLELYPYVISEGILTFSSRITPLIVPIKDLFSVVTANIYQTDGVTKIGEVFRQGKFVYGFLTPPPYTFGQSGSGIKFPIFTSTGMFGYIPEGFRPNNTIQTGLQYSVSFGSDYNGSNRWIMESIATLNAMSQKSMFAGTFQSGALGISPSGNLTIKNISSLTKVRYPASADNQGIDTYIRGTTTFATVWFGYEIA